MTEAPTRAPALALNLVRVSSPDGTCSQEEVCSTKTSCQYWLDRETKYKAGEDPSYVTEARAQICNKKRRALCCPLDVESLTSNPPFQGPADPNNLAGEGT